MSQLTTIWKERAKTFAHTLANFAFPPVCAGCRKPGKLFCAGCWNDIYWLNESLCPHCLKEIHDFPCCAAQPMAIYTAVAYVGPVPKAIHHLKYEGHFAVASPLAQIMIASWQENWVKPDCLIPIPLHKTREKMRSYNQAALLAEEISKEWSIPCQADALFRISETTPQVGLNASERKTNVINAFWANECIKGQSVLLIDDVYTTGATMEAAAKALINGGAKEVMGFALAKSTLLL